MDERGERASGREGERAAPRAAGVRPSFERLVSEVDEAAGASMSAGMGVGVGGGGGPAQGVRPSIARLMETADAAPEPDPLMMEEDLGGGVRRWLRPLIGIVAALSAIAAIVVGAQAAVLINEIEELPEWAQPIGYGVLGLALAVLVYQGARLAWAYARLRVTPRLDLEEELRERADSRELVGSERLAEARRVLMHVLKEFTLAPAQVRRLKQLGLDPLELDTLRAARRVLMSPEAPGDDREWVRKFERDFLGPLDALAERRHGRALKSVFVLTAASPRGSIDTIVVLTLSYRLVREMAEIYNVRAGRWDTALLLVRVLVNTAAASQVDVVGDHAGQAAGHWMAGVAHGAAATAAGVAGKVMGKAAEGGVNTLLLWRLGVRTQAYLRPVRRRG